MQILHGTAETHLKNGDLLAALDSENASQVLAIHNLNGLELLMGAFYALERLEPLAVTRVNLRRS